MTEHRCALVTGGSRGIGAAVAVRLAREGYDVAFCYRSDRAAGERVASAIEDAGARCYHDTCDVADRDSVHTFVGKAEAELGPVYALVNSAGITRDRPLALLPDEDWTAVIDTNLGGTYHFCRAVVFGLMKRKSGVIVNMSSVAGVQGQAGQTNYSASKAGVIGLSRALAKELAPSGVRVNVVAPGFIDTDMTSAMTDRARAAALTRIPLRRFGTAEGIAEITSFLISDRSDYMTGQVVQVDGGVAL